MTASVPSSGAPAADSPVRSRAAELSGDAQQIIGPLNGYHHEAYAFPLPEEQARALGFARVKLRVPHKGLLWFDRRCFESEDELLGTLKGRVTRVPELLRVGEDVLLHEFIEGRTLGDCGDVGKGLSKRHLNQLGRLFQELAFFDLAVLEDGGDGRRGVRRVCGPVDRPADGDTERFLERLVRFTEQRVYSGHGKDYADLFAALGIDAAPLEEVSRRLGSLTRRPFVLLHGDLHPKNVIVDTAGDLWFVDWELAMVGDPLYDLATHLHLTCYEPRAAAEVKTVWAAAVGPARSRGWQTDLPLLLAYKRVQSLYTDIIRAAMRLAEAGTGPGLFGQLEAEAAAIATAVQQARRGLSEAGLGHSGLPRASAEHVRRAYRTYLENLLRPPAEGVGGTERAPSSDDEGISVSRPGVPRPRSSGHAVPA